MIKVRSSGNWSALLAVVATAALAACGGGGDSSPASASMGTLRVALTDAPNCRVGNEDLDKVYVTVEQVRVHQSSDAEPSNGGWTDIAISPARKINLLDLTNGRLEELGTTPIPAGNYTQVRLVLSANQGNQTANSLVLMGDTVEIPLRTPSAAQSGLKIVRPFTVQPNTLVDLVIDFDACRSIVQLGRGSGGYLLKPILTAHSRIVAAIRGFVDPAIANVTVSAQKNGAVVRSTVPATNGEFVLAFLDPAGGPYDVVVTSPARGTSVVGAVPVATTNSVVELSTAAQPTPLPAASAPTASRSASGTVGPAGTFATGVVRAVQAVGAAVPVVEIATDNVDGTTGEYGLTLPLASPLYAPFATTLPLVFTTPLSPPADFSYRLEATAIGYVRQTSTFAPGSTAISWSPVLAPTP